MKYFLFIPFVLLGCNFARPGTWSLINCGAYKCSNEMSFSTQLGCEAARDAGNKASTIGGSALQYSCSEEK